MRRSQASLLGGAFIGVLSALPVVSLGNYCCCLWVVTGGLLAVYLQMQGRTGPPLQGADAALSGLLAGLIGAVFFVLFNTLLISVAGDRMQAEIQAMLEQYAGVPPEIRDRVLALSSGPALILVMAFTAIPVYAIFGALGGLLGLAIFGRRRAPADH